MSASNIQAAGSYLTSTIFKMDELQQTLMARSIGANDVLFADIADTLEALTKYLVNLQSALEMDCG